MKAKETCALNLPAQNRSTVSITIVLALGVAAIFTLPYLVPVHDGISYSYMFGFNNRAAILLLLAVAATFGLWSHGLGMVLPDANRPSPAFRRTAYVTIALSILLWITLWLLSIPIVPLGEAQYFLDRYEMYRLLGPPYKAFTFYYGPIMFYLPVWIAHIAHISIANAYFLALTLEWALGTWMLWRIVVMAANGTRHGRTIFLFFFLFFLASWLGSGAQYTPLRFCPGPFFALLVCRQYDRNASPFAIFSLASLGVVATLFYSPEQGIAFVLGTLTFFLFCVRKRGPGMRAGLVGFTVAVAVALLVALKIGELDSLISIGGGALNFPILANLHTVFLILMLILAGSLVVAAFRKATPDHPLVYLVCLSFFTLPAAMSRADIGHIVINTLGALVAVLIVLSQYPKIWRWFRFVLLIFAIMLLYGLPAVRPILRERLLTAAFSPRFHSSITESILTRTLTFVDGPRAGARIDQLRSQYGKQLNPQWPSLPSSTRFYAPFGIDRRMQPYPGDPEIDTGRSIIPLTGLPVIKEKIGELDARSNWPLLLLSPQPISCEENPNDVSIGLKRLLSAPYIPPPRHQVTAANPLCDYINANYAPAPFQSPVPGFYVWIRKAMDDTHP